MLAEGPIVGYVSEVDETAFKRTREKPKTFRRATTRML
jgi:hypothetical protein